MRGGCSVTSAPITTPITQLSRAISAAGEAAPPISRIARIYGGSFYRSAEWSTHPDTLANQAAMFALRVSALACNSHQHSVVISDNMRTDGCTVTVPIHLAIEAIGNTTRTDEAFDLIAGMALLRSFHTAMPQSTRTGIGATTLPLPAWADLAMVRKHFEICGCGLAMVEGANRAQSRLASCARSAIAAQLASEANDPAISAIDRAKRLAIASRLDLQSLLLFTATDADAQRLSDYADEYGVLDDGSQAFAAFGEQEKQEEEAKANGRETGTQQEKRRKTESEFANSQYRDGIKGLKQEEPRAAEAATLETTEAANLRYRSTEPTVRGGAKAEERAQVDALAATASDDIDAPPTDGQGKARAAYSMTGVSIT